MNAEVLLDHSKWEKNYSKSKKVILKIIKKFSKKLQIFNKKVIFTILLTNNKKIKYLNKKFRKKNKPTDILSLFHFLIKKL